MAARDDKPVDHGDSWLWNALWTGCASGSIRGKVHALDTVIFTRGVPTRWLHTLDNGFLIARKFNDQHALPVDDTVSMAAIAAASATSTGGQLDPAGRAADSGPAEAVTQQAVMMRLSETLQAFIRFVTTFQGGSPPFAQSPVALVVYRDGRREGMTVPDFSVMAPHAQWLQSIDYMQPMLPPHEVRIGVYERRTMRVGARVVSGRDFLGGQRAGLLRQLIDQRSETANQATNGTCRPTEPATPEDLYTLNLARMFHSVFTIHSGSGPAPPPFTGNVMSKVPVTSSVNGRGAARSAARKSSSSKPGTAATESANAVFLPGPDGGMLAASGAISKDAADAAISSDSDTGHAATIMSPPPRTVRVAGLAIQFALDSDNKPWLTAPLLISLQMLSPVASGYTKAARMSRAAASGLPGSLPSGAASYPKPHELGVADATAKDLAHQEARAAADACHADLRSLVNEGVQCGLSLKTAWQHFDDGMSGFGRIDETTFRERLALLGITLHDGAFNVLLRRIPRTSDGKIGPDGFRVLIESDPRSYPMGVRDGSPGRRGGSSPGRRRAGTGTSASGGESSDQQHDGGGSGAMLKRSSSAFGGPASGVAASASFASVPSQLDGNASTMSSASTSLAPQLQRDDAYTEARAAYEALQNRLNAMSKSRKDKAEAAARAAQQSAIDVDRYGAGSAALALVQPEDIPRAHGDGPYARLAPTVREDIVDSVGARVSLSDGLSSALSAAELQKSLSASVLTSGSAISNARLERSMIHESLTDVMPVDNAYDIRPSGVGYDVAPRQGALLAPDARPTIVSSLMDLVVGGNGAAFGLVDDDVQEQIAAERDLRASGTAHTSAQPGGANTNLLATQILQGGGKVSKKVDPAAISGPMAYAASARPRGFEDAWKKEREKIAARQAAELQRDIERAKRKEREKQRRDAIATAMKENAAAGPVEKAKRRRLRRAMQHFGGNGASQSLQNSDVDGDDALAIAEAGAMRAVGFGPAFGDGSSAAFTAAGSRDDRTSKVGLSQMLADAYMSDQDLKQDVDNDSADSEDYDTDALGFRSGNDSPSADGGSGYHGRSGTRRRHRKSAASAAAAAANSDATSVGGLKQNDRYLKFLIAQAKAGPVGLAGPGPGSGFRSNQDAEQLLFGAVPSLAGSSAEPSVIGQLQHAGGPGNMGAVSSTADGGTLFAPDAIARARAMRRERRRQESDRRLQEAAYYAGNMPPDLQRGASRQGARARQSKSPGGHSRSQSRSRSMRQITADNAAAGGGGSLDDSDPSGSGSSDGEYLLTQQSVSTMYGSVFTDATGSASGSIGTLDEELERRRRFKQLAGPSGRASVIYESPQEWTYDHDTTVLFQIVLGPAMVQTPVGAVSVVEAAVAGYVQVGGRDGHFEATYADVNARSRPQTTATAGGESVIGPATTVAAPDGSGGSDVQFHVPPAAQLPQNLRSPYASGRPVDILYIPDIYEDCDGIAKLMLPTLSECPGSRLLIFQYPGLPGTKWKEDKGARPPRWSADFCALILLQFVRWARQEGIWGPVDVQHPHGEVYDESQGRIHRDVIIIGSGLGGHIASVFTTQFVSFQPDFSGHRFSTLGGPGSRDYHLMASMRSLVLINGFGYPDKGIKANFDRLAQVHKQLSEITTQLAPSMLQRMEQSKGAVKGPQQPAVPSAPKATSTMSGAVSPAEIANGAAAPGTSRPSGRRNPDKPGARGSLFLALRYDPFKPGNKPGPADILRSEANQALMSFLYGPTFTQDYGQISPLVMLFQSNRHIADGEPGIDKGLAFIARGVGRGMDVRPNLRDMPIPMLLIAGTEDAFVTPTHSHDFALQRVKVGSKGAEKVVNGPGSVGASLNEFLMVAGQPPQQDQLAEYVGDGGTDAMIASASTSLIAGINHDAIAFLRAAGLNTGVSMAGAVADNVAGAVLDNDNVDLGGIATRGTISSSMGAAGFKVVRDAKGRTSLRPSSSTARPKPAPVMDQRIANARPGTLEAGLRDTADRIREKRGTNSRPTHVVWLKGGHALIHERRRFLLKTLVSLFHGHRGQNYAPSADHSDAALALMQQPPPPQQSAWSTTAAASQQYAAHGGTVQPVDFPAPYGYPQAQSAPGAQQQQTYGYARTGDAMLDSVGDFLSNLNVDINGANSAVNHHQGLMLTSYSSSPDTAVAGATFVVPPQYQQQQYGPTATGYPSSPFPEATPGAVTFSSSSDAAFISHALPTPGPHHYAVTASAAASPYLPPPGSLFAEREQLQQERSRAEAKSKVAQELARRRLPTHGTELELLTRLEEALEQEEIEANKLEEQTSDSRAVRLRKQMRFEAEMEEKRRLRDADASAAAASGDRKPRKVLRPPPGVRGGPSSGSAAGGGPEGQSQNEADGQDVVVDDVMDKQEEWREMTEADAASHRLEAYYRAQAQRDRDASVLLSAMTVLQKHMADDEMQWLHEALLAAVGKDNLKHLHDKGILSPQLLSTAADQLTIGDKRGASKTIATGLAYLTYAAGIAKASELDAQARSIGTGATKTGPAAAVPLPDSDGKQNGLTSSSSSAAAAAEPAIDARRAFLELHLDLRRTRAAKLAVLRARVVVESLNLRGEEQGYGLDSEDPRVLHSGSRRLVSHVNELRVRKRNAMRRWRRTLHKVRMQESDILREAARLRTIERAKDMAVKEEARVRQMLAAAGIKNELIEASAAIKTATNEIAELGLRIAGQEAHIKSMMGQLEIMSADLQGQSAALKFTARKCDLKEAALREMRAKISKLISQRRDERRDNKAIQEQATAEVGAALAQITVQQARLSELKNEKLRLRNVKVRFSDTTVWNAGVIQRVKTKDLKAWLSDEILRFKVMLAEGIVAVERLRSQADAAEARYGHAHEDVLTLSRILEVVVECVRLGPASKDASEPTAKAGAASTNPDGSPAPPSQERDILSAAEADVIAAEKRVRDANNRKNKSSRKETHVDDDHDADDEDEGGDDGAGAGGGTGKAARRVAAADAPASRREANITWRAMHIARAAEREAYCAEILGSRDHKILGEIGALVERVPGTNVQLGWVSNWMDMLNAPLPPEVQAAVATPSPLPRAAATAEEQEKVKAADSKPPLNRKVTASKRKVLSPVAEESAGDSPDSSPRGGMAAAASGRHQASSSSADPGATAAELDEPAEEEPIRLGYASMDTLASGLSTVIGTPAHPHLAAIPLSHLPGEMVAVETGTGEDGRPGLNLGTNGPSNLPDQRPGFAARSDRRTDIEGKITERDDEDDDDGNDEDGYPRKPNKQNDGQGGAGASSSAAAAAPGQQQNSKKAAPRPDDPDSDDDGGAGGGNGESKAGERGPGNRGGSNRPSPPPPLPTSAPAPVPNAGRRFFGMPARQSSNFNTAMRDADTDADTTGGSPTAAADRPQPLVSAPLLSQGPLRQGSSRRLLLMRSGSTDTGGFAAGSKRRLDNMTAADAGSGIGAPKKKPIPSQFHGGGPYIGVSSPGFAGFGHDGPTPSFASPSASVRSATARPSNPYRFVAPTIAEQMESVGLRLVPESKLAVVTRWRPAFDRSKEQKQWIAIDRRMHPKLYAQISKDDQDVYGADPLYRTLVPKTTLFRIASLPCSPLQALAYLRSSAEVRIHALLVKYLHGQGEDAERLRDQESGARGMATAAVARGYVARTKPPSLRTQEERDWVSLDRLLRPHLYLGEPQAPPFGSPRLRRPGERTSSAQGRRDFKRRLLERQASAAMLRAVSARDDNDAADASPATGSSFGPPAAAAGSRAKSGSARMPSPPPPPATAPPATAPPSTPGQAAASAPAAAAGAAHAINAGDADLGLDTYEHNLSAEGIRRTEGSFGGAVRKIFRKVFQFNAKQEGKAAEQAEKAAIQRQKAADARRKAMQSEGGMSGVSLSSGTTKPGIAADINDKAESDEEEVDEKDIFEERPPRIPGAKGIQLQNGRIRPPGGTIGLGYTRADLLRLLDLPSAHIRTRKDRRAQLLLRAYGSDGGEWVYRSALAVATPVVSGLAEIAEATETMAEELKLRKDVDYSSELALSYPDGDTTNVAAAAGLAANGLVLVRANHVLEVLSINDAPLRPGVTVDHEFEVPGSIFDAIGYGPRAVPATPLGGMPTDAFDAGLAATAPGVGPSDPSQQIHPNPAVGPDAPPTPLLAPAASASIGMGLPPSWQSLRSEVNLGQISQAETAARGVDLSAGEGGNADIPPTPGAAVANAKGNPTPTAATNGGANIARPTSSASSVKGKPTPTPTAAASTAGANAVRPGTAAAPGAASVDNSNRGPVEGGIASSLANAAPDPEALKTQAEKETGVVGAQAMVVDMSITIAFHGTFIDKSYVLGKLTAGVYREAFVSPDDHPALASDPTSIFAPAIYAQQNEQRQQYGDGWSGGDASAQEAPSLHISSPNGKIIHTVALLQPPYIGNAGTGNGRDDDDDIPNDDTFTDDGLSTARPGSRGARRGSAAAGANNRGVPPLGGFGNRHMRGRLGAGGIATMRSQGSGPGNRRPDADDANQDMSTARGGLPSPTFRGPRAQGRAPPSAGGLSIISETSVGNGSRASSAGRPGSSPGRTGGGQHHHHHQTTAKHWDGILPIRPLPPHLSHIGISVTEDETGRIRREMPGYPMVAGVHNLDSIEGPPGLPPSKPAAHVLRALKYPNDVDPLALARAVNKKGDLSKNQGLPSIAGSGLHPALLVDGAATAFAPTLPPILDAGTDGAIDISSLPHDGMLRSNNDDGNNSDPEVYNARDDVLVSSRLYARHKRRTKLVKDGVVQGMESKLSMRKGEGWFFDVGQTHTAVAASGATGASANTLAGMVDTSINIAQNTNVWLYLDGTVGRPGDPDARPASEVQQLLFKEESLGADDIASATVANQPIAGTMTMLEATGLPAAIGATISNAIVPKWRRERADKLRYERTKGLLVERVSRGMAATMYDTAVGGTVGVGRSRRRRPRSADAANARIDDTNSFGAGTGSNNRPNAKPSTYDRSADPAADAEYEYDEDGFVVVKKPGQQRDGGGGGGSSGRSNAAAGPRMPSDADVYPRFERARFNPDSGSNIPIGVGASSGAGDGSGAAAGPDAGPARVKVPKRPLTYHPSQAPPLARTPPTNLLPHVAQDQVASTMRHPVGYAVTSECQPNSIDGFGRIVVRHEPLTCPVIPGKYIVSITGLSPGSYSISVVCGLAYAAQTVAEGAIRAAAASKSRMGAARNDVTSIIQAQRLGQRKKELVGHLITTTDEKLQMLQGQINRLRAGLEKGIILRGELGSDDDDDFQATSRKADLLAQAADDGGSSGSSAASDDDDESGSDGSGTSANQDDEAGATAANDKDLQSSDPVLRAVAIARRKRQKLDVTEAVRARVQKRLGKLDRKFVVLVRQLHTRRREYNDVTDGISALVEARVRREGDLAALMVQSKEYARSMPALITAMHLAQSDPLTGILPLPAAYSDLNAAVAAGQTSVLRRDSLFASMGMTNINELLSLNGGPIAAAPAAVDQPPAAVASAAMLRSASARSMKSVQDNGLARHESHGYLIGVGENIADQRSPGSKSGTTWSLGGAANDDQDDPEEDDKLGTGVDGLPAGPPEGTTLALVRGAGHAKTIMFRYYYPVADAEEALYVRHGPWVLLWQKNWLANHLLDMSLTPAETVRRKRVDDLNDEEKQWMAYDRVLHPELYEVDALRSKTVDVEVAEDDDDLQDDEVNEMDKQLAREYAHRSAQDAKQKGAVATHANGSKTGPTSAGAGVSSGLAATGKLAPDNAAAAVGGTVIVAGDASAPSDEDGAIVRYDLEAPSKAILKAVYLSSEDKAGLRGNRRDIGPQTTAIMMSEGTQLMSEQLAHDNAIKHGMSDAVAGSAVAVAGGNGNVSSALRGLEVGLPAVEGGLGWSRDIRSTSYKSTAESRVAQYKSKLDKVLPTAEYSRDELERFMTVPIQQLTPPEREVRRLLAMYHDHAVPTPAYMRTKTRSGDGTAFGSRGDIATAASDTSGGGKAKIGTVIGTGLGGGGAREMVYDETTGEFKYDETRASEAELASKAQAFTQMKRFQAVGSAFAVARSAVPIPVGAPAKLRHVLQERSKRLQTMWVKTLTNMVHSQAVDGGRPGNVVSADVDERSRDLLTELDRANACNRPFMDSLVLHGQEQRFDTRVLRDQLEMELDRVLMAQVYEREAIEKALLQEAADTAAVDAAKAAAAEAVRLRKRREATLLKMAQQEELRRRAADEEAIRMGKKVLLTADEVKDRQHRAAIRATMGTDNKRAASGADPKGSKIRTWKGEGYVALEDERDKTFDLDGEAGINVSIAGTAYGGGDYDYDSKDPLKEIGALALWGDPDKPLTPRRAARKKAEMLAERMRKKTDMQSTRGAGTEAIAGRLSTITNKRREAARTQRDLAKASVARATGGRTGVVKEGTMQSTQFAIDGDEETLQPGQCGACFTVPCAWTPTVDVPLVKERKDAVDRELFRIRRVPELDATGKVQTFIRSEVALSYLRGAPAKQTKADLVFELAYELSALKGMIRLAEVDAELHNCYASREEAVTTVVLHGYPQQTWRPNAIVQLEAEVNRIIAKQVASALIDDVLEYMLEGWYFGERKSELLVAGYVPSLNQDRPLRPFEATSTVAQIYTQQGPAAKARAADAAHGLVAAIGDASANIAAVDGLARFGLVTMNVSGLPMQQGPGPASFASSFASSAAQPPMNRLLLGGGTGWTAGAGSNSSSPFGFTSPLAPGSMPLNLVYSPFGSVPSLHLSNATTRAGPVAGSGIGLASPMAVSIAAPSNPPLGYRDGFGAQLVASQPSFMAQLPNALDTNGAAGAATARSTGAQTFGRDGNITMTIGPSAQDMPLPPGFFRVDDEAHAQRLRSQIAAQQALHEYLLAGTGVSTAAFQQAMATAAINGTSGGGAGMGGGPDSMAHLLSATIAAVTAGMPGGPAVHVPTPAELALARPGAASGGGTGLQAAILRTGFGPRMLALQPEDLGSGTRVTREQKAAGIQFAVEARTAIRKAIEAQAKVLHAMDETETSLRYGMFLLALMYFRIMNQLAKLKSSFSGDVEAVSLAPKSSAEDGTTSRNLGLVPATMAAMTAERRRMIESEKNKLKREAAKAIANAKATAGFASILARRTAVETADRMHAVRKERKKRKQTAAAVTIQCAYRGFRVRRTIDDFKRRKNAHDEYQSLRHYAATRIQALWRGYMARLLVAEKREELLNFVKFYRSNEAGECWRA